MHTGTGQEKSKSNADSYSSTQENLGGAVFKLGAFNRMHTKLDENNNLLS